MIIEMARIRVLGPAAALSRAVRAMQDAAVVHIADPPCEGALLPRDLDPVIHRREHQLARVLAEIAEVYACFSALGAPVHERPGAWLSEGRAAFRLRRLHERLEQMLAFERSLIAEREALRMYEPLFADLESLFANLTQGRVSMYLLRLRGPAACAELRSALDRALGPAYALRSHDLRGGEAIVLLLVPSVRADEIDRQLTAAGVDRAALPGNLGAMSLAEALRSLGPRLAAITAELAAIRAEATELARERGDELSRARRDFHDRLLAVQAEQRAAISSRAFALEGWLPAREVKRLAAALAETVGAEISVEVLARDAWKKEDAPVVLANPRIFAPFEALTSLLPLPRYGSVDPTPFVAVFFPMLFGVIVGDIGYGLVMIAVALGLRLSSRPASVARSIARIAVAVSTYTILFGAFYGELFGDLGTRAFGLHPLWFDRQEAVLAFLVLAVALGTVHILVGLIVAAINRWRRDRRESIGRGLTAVMIVLLALALLALFERVPGVLLMPSVIALLLAFAVVIVLEGAAAILDFMSVVNHVLSYARVMALGTASVMLAIVANRMHGAFGSLALGIAFALVFHLINFALALFSPTIQVMRLHYVEFFDTFFEPGGGPYRPLRHWSPT